LKYNGTTLVKANVIEKANITNSDYLQSRKVNASYVFAKVDNIRGSEASEWEEIYSGTTTFSEHGFVSTDEQTIITSIQTQGRSLRVDGNIKFSFAYYSFGEKKVDYTLDIGRILLKDGDRYEFTQSHIASSWQGIVYETTVTFEYRSGVLTAQSIIRGDNISSGWADFDWSVVINITSASVLPDDVVSGSANINGIDYLFGETTFNLTDESAVFTIPFSDAGKVTARASYQKTNNVDGSVNTEEKPVYIPGYFSSLEEFRSYVENTSGYQVGSIICYIGVKEQHKREKEGHIRFDKTFVVYTCTMIGARRNDGSYDSYDNISVNLTTTSGTAYKQTDYTYTRQSADIVKTSNDFSIDGNSLMQEETTIDGQEAMPQILAGVINQYKNGRNVVKVTVAYGKFYFIGDNNSVSTDVAYNGEDGDFIKVGDICALYTIRNGNTVPLYQKQNKLPTAFKVTSSNIRYNGNFIINLEMIEHIA